ncbi:STAS domain-containing protein [Acinetobacter sp. S40]|uniref:STAS domain-containing protein n=1 Tax=unclassified Acinetobacter TaxID=196816 RepID=UPI00190E2D3A|nr:MULTISPECIES: STAS domain-containing protein [unclassified Acinetobacter]MBJ9986241.1 STAS domain-containing protein [Acinetobacter sp. S40]MBK0064213.1 STAS domain-containing protein [Acinetobacter sp. S55]MBK0067595.1 STAS domain-containing protein [Acinetobacter sp. S54]
MIEMVDQQLVLSGKIDFENAQTIYQNGLRLIQQHQQFPLVINLSQLQHGSTLALAVLVQWLRKTPNAQGLHFQDVPEKMLKIIQSCHLQDDLTLLHS